MILGSEAAAGGQALLASTAINQDGRSSSLTVSSLHACVDLCQVAALKSCPSMPFQFSSNANSSLPVLVGRWSSRVGGASPQEAAQP